jgi:hypothetical protein
MNETEHPLVFAPMYSTGLLTRVEYSDGLIRLHLRDDVPGVKEYRVAVWERWRPLPRVIDSGITEAHGSLIDVLDIGIEEPLGWAISFDNNWRGVRFAVEPGSAKWLKLREDWCTMLESAPDWQATAKALCAWRFPVLLEPFRGVVQSRVKDSPVETLFAWTEQVQLSSCLLTVEPAFYEAALRELLWDVAFSEVAIDVCWAHHSQVVQERGVTPELYPPAQRLLQANPVLLTKILGDGLLRRYREGIKSLPQVKDSLFGKMTKPDELAVRRHRDEFRRYAQVILLSLKGAFGGNTDGRPDDLTTQEREALSGLRSWSDNRPIDDHYFRKHVRDVADALYGGGTVDTTRLQLAVARSPLCSAYLASFLFCRNVFHPLEKGEL